MNEDAILEAAGGRKEILMGADPMDPSAAYWNFGLFQANAEVMKTIEEKDTLYGRFPYMQGKWDGRSTVNHFDAATKVLKDDATNLIQSQPRGTCGGRAGSAAVDLIQCVLIAMGKRARFYSASHAFLYWQARKMYNMDKGNPSNDRNDGVLSGSIPAVLTKVGAVHREESGDLKHYGAGSDDLATRWGAGQIGADLAMRLESLAADNVITDWAPVKSAQEAADGIASGGIVIGADSQGFTMQRDSQGFCTPRGTWHHYHVRMSVGRFNNRPGFGYFQSWGRSNPSGPLLPGHPGNCFGVDFTVQDACIKRGHYAVVFGFPLWELEEGKTGDVSWIF